MGASRRQGEGHGGVSNSTEHQNLVNEILVALSACGVLCWPIHTGVAVTPTGRVDEASGIARAWREGREFGHNVAAVWAEAI